MEYALQRKRVLVTGATGFIGGNVVQQLLHTGAQVRALVRTAAKADFLSHLGVEIIPGDITDPAALQRAVHGCHVVCHFAGVLHDFKPYSYYFNANVRGTEMLAEAALEAGIERFVYASTVFVYGLNAVGVVTEASPLCKSGDSYSDSKLDSEQLIRRLIPGRQLPAVIIQPSQVYGPEDTTWTLGPFQMIRSGRMVLVNGGLGLVQPVYIDDLVDGIMAAICRGRVGESYILCGPAPVAIREFFGFYMQMAGRKKIPSVPAWVALRMAGLMEGLARINQKQPLFRRQDVRYVSQQASYDGSKAFEHLGWRSTTKLPQGMKHVEAWLRERGEL